MKKRIVGWLVVLLVVLVMAAALFAAAADDYKVIKNAVKKSRNAPGAARKTCSGSRSW